MHDSLSGFLRKWTRHIDTAGSASAHATDLLAAGGGHWQEKKKKNCYTVKWWLDNRASECTQTHERAVEKAGIEPIEQPPNGENDVEIWQQWFMSDNWKWTSGKKSVGEKYEMMMLTGEEQNRVTKSEMMVSHFFASLETENCLKK